MKNISRLLCLVFLSTALFSSLKSQVSSLYTFSQSNGTYSAIGGGTVFGSTTSDDQVFVDLTSLAGVNAGSSGAGIPIGFNFLFNNTIFDRIGIANDGWIMFGQSALGTSAVNSNSSNYYTPISATSTASNTLQNRVAALARDLQGQTGSDLRAQTIGTAPNQTMVIQWSNYRKYNATGDNFSFQIRLYETSNIVEISYGAFVNGATAGVAELGLRGVSNADFNNRVTNSTNTWSNSVAGTTNNATVNFNNTPLVPSFGQSYKWTPPQCSGSLSSLATTGSAAFVCPGAPATLSLSNTYTTSGISYQWQYSANSATGPFTTVSNANSAIYSVPSITASTWFQVISTCLSSSSTATSTPYNVQMAGVTISNVPYFESFEGLIVNNQLPNCSWVASNMPAICQTYTTANTNNRIPATGNKFAAFKSGTNPNGDFFYTNGLQLYAGITYSASVAYITDGNLGWNNLSLLYGSAQSSVGLTAIASVGPATGVFYQQLTNTFMVPASGVYYLAVKCIANTTPQFLSFDDIRVTIPCSLNSPSLSVSASSPTACTGQPITLTAAGADTYTWGPGLNTSVITVTPSSNTFFTVFGTNTLSACTSSAGVALSILPSPVISVFATPPSICIGSTATLNAFGGATYVWSNGVLTPITVVSPSATTIYSVISNAANGCPGTATVQISVNNLPNVTITSSVPNELCLGETATLTASGAVNYQWAANTLFIQSAQAVISPTVLTTYTLSATDANGCVKTTVYAQPVISCVGVNEVNDHAKIINLLPNPATDFVRVEFQTHSLKTLRISDLQGRVLLSFETSESGIHIGLETLSPGVYFLQVNCGNAQSFKKFVKN